MRRVLVFILLACALITPLYAQSEAELRKTIDRLEASIEQEEKELAKLKGRYYGSFTKGAIKSAKKEIQKISEKVSNTVEGFIEGVK